MEIRKPKLEKGEGKVPTRPDQVGVDAEHRGIAERKRKKPSNASSGFTFLEELRAVAQCASCCVTPTKEARKLLIPRDRDGLLSSFVVVPAGTMIYSYENTFVVAL